MAKRYYLAPVIGTGTMDDAFRPQTKNYGGTSTAVIPSHQTTGQPLFTWALVIVDKVDHTGLLADTAIDPLPDISLDSKISTLSNTMKNRLTAALTKYGIDPTTNANTTLRDIVLRCGQKLDPTFSENNFDVTA